MNKVQIEQKTYEMPPHEGVLHRIFSHCRRYRTIGSILRNGLRRPYSEPGRRQRTWVPSTREYLDDNERRGRTHPRQTDGNAQRA